jgi:hypothetical protein
VHLPKLRFVAPVAAVLGVALLGGAAWVNASSSSPLGIPQLNAAPLIASTGVSEAVSAVVTGAADAVELVITDPATGDSSVVPMQEQDEDIWTGSIPSSLFDDADLVYSVSAALDDVTKHSETAELVVLDSLRRSTPALVENSGRTLLAATLGDGPDELGVRGGRESAKELPPSFAVDGEERVHVLDAVKSRVLVFDGSGAAASRFELTGLTTTASDLVLGEGGATFVLDQAKDAIEEIASDGRRTYRSELGVRTQPLGTVLEHVRESATTYVREATQGLFIPVLKDGRVVSTADRDTDTRAGVPSPEGDLAVEVAGRTVTYALSSDRTAGYRLTFTDQVLDAAETVVDDDGFVWSLVGVYNSGSETASKYLVRIDPDTGSSRMVRVGSSVPGDVTRRLVGARRGVALMEGNGKTLSFVRYQEI